MLDERSASNRKWASVGLLAGFLAATALAAAAYFVAGPRLAQPSAATSSAIQPEDAVKLVVKPHTIVSTTDKAMLASSGDKIPPWGVPVMVSRFSPCSVRIPARRNACTQFRTRLSAMRCRTPTDSRLRCHTHAVARNAWARRGAVKLAHTA